jgi:hypothetical protein
MDWFDKVVGLAWLALTYQQNQILRAANPVQHPSQERLRTYAQRYWPMAVMVVLGVAIWLPRVIPIPSLSASVEPLHGTADVPAQIREATISIPVSLPYTVHGLTADWNSNIVVTAKRSGSFTVSFSEYSPEGGGSLDWEVIPRAGSRSVATTETETPTATSTPTPTPKPWQSFAENGYAGQVFVREIQQNPIPGPHTVSIVATETSHQFVVLLLGWLQGSNKWAIIEHGQKGAFIGQPSEYALDDGITIRARAGSVDAETLRLAFRVMGLNVQRVILPDTDNRTYVIVEVGNIPADQR